MNKMMRSLLALLSLFGVLAYAAAAGGADGRTQGTSPTAEAKVRVLLDAAAASLEDVRGRFAWQGDSSERQRVTLSPDEEARLKQACADLFKGLGDSGNGPSLDRLALQAFRNNYPGGPEAWRERHLATERALMMGRALLVKEIWADTLADFIAKNPDKGALLVGQIDIGSWIDMKLGGLSFPADIDFSVGAVDVRVGPEVVALFEEKLKARTGRDMVQLDALCTPHGAATEHVFVGEWGRAFAEMELVKEGARVKVFEREPPAEGQRFGRLKLDSKGRPIVREMAGEHLFWEIALLRGEPVDYPKFDLKKEPMSSLEMWRHEKHDISTGPFSDADKLMKVLKYLERSSAINDKALAAYRGQVPGGSPALLAFAKQMMEAKRNKLSGEAIDALVKAYATAQLGEEFSPGNYGTIVKTIEARAQIAMLDNSASSIVCRLGEMAAITDNTERAAQLQQFWTDLDTEIAALQHSHVEVPDFVAKASELAKQVHQGDLTPEVLAQRAAELRKLLKESYKYSDIEVDHLMDCDPYAALTKYFREKFPQQDERVKAFIDGMRTKYPNAAAAYATVMRVNDEWNQSIEGSKVMSSLDHLDNALAIYDAAMSGKDAVDSSLQVAKAMLLIKAAGKFPVLNIGTSCWEAYQKGEPGPALKGIGFYYFPTIGALYGLSEKCERLDAFCNDENFFRHLVSLRDNCSFNASGQMTQVNIKGAISELNIPASENADVRARAFVDYCLGQDDLNTWGTGNPALRYWATLIPREGSEYGMGDTADRNATLRKWDVSGYVKKMERLRDLLPHAALLHDLTRLLQDVRGQPWPQDGHEAERLRIVREHEDAIERALWRALFDMLEASADPSVGRMRADLEALEHDLSLGDTHLGVGQGLMSRVDAELAQARRYSDKGYAFADRFVYTRYLEAYRKVAAVRDRIMMLWTRTYDVKWETFTGEPLKGLLGGARGAAPRLTGVPEMDVRLAESCLSAHLRRASDMAELLETALRRAIDPENDRDLLVELAALQSLREHLRDDCPERRVSGGSPAVIALEKDLRKQVNDMLNRIRPENYRFLVLGKTSCKVGEKVVLEARPEGMSEAIRRRLSIEWPGLDAKGRQIVITPSKEGRITLHYEAYGQVKGQRTKFGQSAVFTLDVKGAPKMDPLPSLGDSLRILSRTKAVRGEKIAFIAKAGTIPSDQLSRYRFRWFSETENISLGRGLKTVHAPRTVGTHVIRVEVSELDDKGVESKRGEARTRVEIAHPDSAPATAAGRGQQPVYTGPALPIRDDALIHCPSEVVSDEPFTVSLRLPDGIGPVEYVGWERVLVLDGSASSPTRQLVCVNRSDSVSEAWFKVYAYRNLREVPWPERADKRRVVGECVYEGTRTVRVLPARPALQPPAGWISPPWQTLFTEQSFSRKIKLFNRDSGREDDAEARHLFRVRARADIYPQHDYVGGDLQQSWQPLAELMQADRFAVRRERLLKDFRDQAVAERRSVQPISLGAFKGYIAEEPFAFHPPAGPSDIYAPRVTYAGGSWSASILLFDGQVCLSGSMDIVLTGHWDGLDNDWIKSTYPGLRSQLLSSLATLRLRRVAGATELAAATTGKTAVASKEAGPPLVAQLVAELVPSGLIRPGQTQGVRATAVGGRPPYAFAWAGAEGKGDTAKARPTVPGSHRVRVTVTDAAGSVAQAEACVDVAPGQVEVLAPARATMGETCRFTAKVDYAGNDYLYHWYVGDGTALEIVGSGVLEQAIPELGKVPVRVEVRARDKETGAWVKYADSEPAFTEVGPPSFQVVFTPMDARPGDEVVAEVRTGSAAVDALLSFWWETPDSSNRWEYDDPASRIGFKLREAKPVSLTAKAYLRENNREVGVLQAVYQPSNYTVRARVVGPANQGPRPMVWSNSAGGLVPVEGGAYGTDESALVAVEITPANDKVRWRWTMNEGTTLQSSELSREIRVCRSSSGTAVCEVVATDPDGVVLGVAAASFPVVATRSVTKPAPLRCALVSEVIKLEVGASAFVSAQVSGGMPPYRFAWSGDYQGDGQSTNFIAARPGKRTLRVRVEDAKGVATEARLLFEVTPKQEERPAGPGLLEGLKR